MVSVTSSLWCREDRSAELGASRAIPGALCAERELGYVPRVSYEDATSEPSATWLKAG